MTTAKKLRAAAEQLREDAADCWGIRRKLNLKAAANIMEQAAAEMEKKAA